MQLISIPTEHKNTIWVSLQYEGPKSKNCFTICAKQCWMIWEEGPELVFRECMQHPICKLGRIMQVSWPASWASLHTRRSTHALTWWTDGWASERHNICVWEYYYVHKLTELPMQTAHVGALAVPRPVFSSSELIGVSVTSRGGTIVWGSFKSRGFSHFTVNSSIQLYRSNYETPVKNYSLLVITFL